MSTKSKGDAAEDKALYMLEQKGMQCLERKFRTESGEIDLIMRDTEASVVVFVEVRSGDSRIFPAYQESITAVKIRKITQVAMAFLDNYTGEYEFLRLDAVFVEKNGETVHLENIAILP